MEEYVLKSQDYEWLKKLISSTASIDTLYSRLLDLEIKGQKDTEEYKKNLEYLVISIEVEDSLYKEGNLTTPKCLALLEDIINERIPEDFLTDRESLMKQDYRERPIRRILKTLLNRISDYDSLRQGELPTSMAALLSHLGVPDAEQKVSTALYRSIELSNALEQDLTNGYLAILQEFINSDSYKQYRNDLIGAKYNAAFINKSVESEMIPHSFNVPGTFFTSARFVADITKTDLELLETIKNVKGLEESTEQWMRLVTTPDADYADEKVYSSAILRQCIIRSSFLLMSDQFLADCNYAFHEFIEGKEFLKENPNSDIGIDLTVRCFKAIKRDRTKLNSVSFGLR